MCNSDVVVNNVFSLQRRFTKMIELGAFMNLLESKKKKNH